MTERPLLMTGPLILATLDGSKTQTRRLPTSATALVDGKRVSPKAWEHCGWDWDHAQVDGRQIVIQTGEGGPWHYLTPIWEVGDHVWLRETWSPMWSVDCDNCEDDPERLDENGHCKHFYVEYKADTGHKRPADWPDPEPNGDYGDAPAWKASIHMFRWASRIDLEVLAVRAERLQDITIAGIIAEGIPAGIMGNHRQEFQRLWDSINSPRDWGWATNRPVFALTYKRIKP
jgi:hypothetical protein